MSPRNNCSSSILSWERATTELSSFTASSTISLLGLDLMRRMAVAKSSLIELMRELGEEEKGEKGGGRGRGERREGRREGKRRGKRRGGGGGGE